MATDPLGSRCADHRGYQEPRQVQRDLRRCGDRSCPLLSLRMHHTRTLKSSSETYEENAVTKAAALADIVGGPAMADDSGIEVEAMGWGPGVRSARTPRVGALSPERNENVLRAVEGRNRGARFVSVCVLVVPGYQPVIARGEVEGLIAPRRLGNNGFGYDPIFWYPPYEATFGQVDAARKHAVSHRGRAVRALKAMLQPLVR